MNDALKGGSYAAELQRPEVYRNRRKRLAEQVGEGTILVWGAGDERGYGDVGTFRQEPSFFYLTGIELPNAVLVLRPHDDDSAEILFLEPRNEPLECWTGPKWGPGDEAAEALGFKQVMSSRASETIIDARRRPVPGFVGRLQSWLCDDCATLWTPLPPLPLEAELGPSHRFLARLRERMQSFTVRDLSGHLDGMRGIKEAGEVELIEQAVAATMAGQRAAAGTIRPGVGETAVEGAVFRAFHDNGAEGLAFPTIVGSGFCGTVLHYDQNTGTCGDGDLVVVDIGARYGYYCGDLTRTYPVNGSFSERQRDIYNLVLEAHDRAAEAMRPGTTIFDLRKIAYNVFQDTPFRDIRGERLGQYFIHGLGHHLGLEAHDPGSDNAELQPGMVITNEPGLYLPDEQLGVRIENDHLITGDGNRNLSSRLPVGAEEIEALMR